MTLHCVSCWIKGEVEEFCLGFADVAISEGQCGQILAVLNDIGENGLSGLVWCLKSSQIESSRQRGTCIEQETVEVAVEDLLKFYACHFGGSQLITVPLLVILLWDLEVIEEAFYLGPAVENTSSEEVTEDSLTFGVECDSLSDEFGLTLIEDSRITNVKYSEGLNFSQWDPEFFYEFTIEGVA